MTLGQSFGGLGALGSLARKFEFESGGNKSHRSELIPHCLQRRREELELGSRHPTTKFPPVTEPGLAQFLEKEGLEHGTGS